MIFISSAFISHEFLGANLWPGRLQGPTLFVVLWSDPMSQSSCHFPGMSYTSDMRQGMPYENGGKISNSPDGFTNFL